MFKIGASSRLYVFHGPADMMPQEGMNQYQKLMMRKLMEAEKQRERDKQVSAENIGLYVFTETCSHSTDVIF